MPRWCVFGLEAMTKRVNMCRENNTKPTRRGGSVLVPVVVLVGICTAWAGFAYQRTNQIEFPRPPRGMAADVLTLIDDGISTLREFLNGYLYR